DFSDAFAHDKAGQFIGDVLLIDQIGHDDDFQIRGPELREPAGDLFQSFLRIFHVEDDEQNDLVAAKIFQRSYLAVIRAVAKIRRHQPGLIFNYGCEGARSLAARQSAHEIDQVPAFFLAQTLTEARHG